MPTRSPKRTTIADVAARAGVSKMAVSFALNGQPGVSEQTRQRVIDAADALGWRPNSAARSLSVDRAGAVGLVLARSADSLETETFYLRLLAGIESELSTTSTALSLQIAQDPEREAQIYRTLAAERRVDAVLISDVLVDDPRIALLHELRLPAVVLGDEPCGFPVLGSDDAGANELVLDHLQALGHRRVARVTESASREYTQRRNRSFLDGLARRGMTGDVREGQATSELGETATAAFLASSERPTAIVYDSDLLAVAGLEVLRGAGVAVPDAMSVVAWDGSILSQIVRPRLTSVKRDVMALGREAGRQLLLAAAAGYLGDVREGGAGGGDDSGAAGGSGGFVADGHDFSQPRLAIADSTAAAPPAAR
ncbi:LacI family DNA-binding transcriptional regulator [Plantibacter sp. Mn2098]|uniref:LacI family DNA-binding transcriptional regulator n=1 Tax=Plantibacter sp. Mn2098 TaxID=3395266 RepID=UPI003BCD4A90